MRIDPWINGGMGVLRKGTVVDSSQSHEMPREKCRGRNVAIVASEAGSRPLRAVYGGPIFAPAGLCSYTTVELPGTSANMDTDNKA